MPVVTSKRNFLGFYVALFFISLFFFLMGWVALGLFIHLYHTSKFETRNYGLIPMFMMVLGAEFYIVYKFIKYAPSIEVNKDFVRINRCDYYWNDLEKIELTGKQPYIFMKLKEGMLLKFRGAKEITVLDDLYANLDEVKLFIKHQVINKENQPVPFISKPDFNESGNERFISYKGSQFYNYRGIILWGIIGGVIYASALNLNHPIGVLALICLGIISFFGLSYFFYYAEVSDSYLLVKNHNFLWVKKIYRLKDIEEIIFEWRDRWPNCLTIITKDFKSDFFPAASLRNKQWRSLKDELESKNVKVRDELYAGKN